MLEPPVNHSVSCVLCETVMPCVEVNERALLWVFLLSLVWQGGHLFLVVEDTVETCGVIDNNRGDQHTASLRFGRGYRF